MPGEIADGEKKIAEFLLHAVGIGGARALAGGDFSLQFFKFFGYLFKRTFGVLPVESDAGVR